MGPHHSKTVRKVIEECGDMTGGAGPICLFTGCSSCARSRYRPVRSNKEPLRCGIQIKVCLVHHHHSIPRVIHLHLEHIQANTQLGSNIQDIQLVWCPRQWEVTLLGTLEVMEVGNMVTTDRQECILEDAYLLIKVTHIIMDMVEFPMVVTHMAVIHTVVIMGTIRSTSNTSTEASTVEALAALTLTEGRRPD
ncbi:hypothetical protein NDU88_004680 [Pleurodeles waltl]|uniref:Uncharacterized protein n=1 Tax=Pleurodeles waltl TaxID=8319 RepID=A0AAV7UFW3_PLEWA|nr:hypothetical protein NDU88_004680 [Pleurodeles waltl]